MTWLICCAGQWDFLFPSSIHHTWCPYISYFPKGGYHSWVLKAQTHPVKLSFYHKESFYCLLSHAIRRETPTWGMCWHAASSSMGRRSRLREGASKPGQFVEQREDTKREFAKLLEINVRVKRDDPWNGHFLSNIQGKKDLIACTALFLQLQLPFKLFTNSLKCIFWLLYTANSSWESCIQYSRDAPWITSPRVDISHQLVPVSSPHVPLPRL